MRICEAHTLHSSNGCTRINHISLTARSTYDWDLVALSSHGVQRVVGGTMFQPLSQPRSKKSSVTTAGSAGREECNLVSTRAM